VAGTVLGLLAQGFGDPGDLLAPAALCSCIARLGVKYSQALPRA
jgi:hypothetical protein